MDEIGVAVAARRLGISEPAVRKMITAGRLPRLPRSGPALVASADVDRVTHERRADALRRHPDPAAFARHVREHLWPGERVARVTLADGRTEIADPQQAHYLFGLDHGRKALATLSPDAVALFGWAAVETAASDRKAFAGACRTCYADTAARVHGGLRPTDAPAYRVLLGDPCPADRKRWAAEAEQHRREVTHSRMTEQRQRQDAERAAARQEFQAARAQAETAASRLRTATRVYAALDPSVAREAATQARARGAFKAASRLPSWCDCDADRQCSKHAEADRRAARRPRLGQR
ncbi:hypothetical protein [Streptomyces sp. NPDC002962]|uniref:hypothetical protein n=1 Tax=Streptomyces sp. NPDC002962 TaxID=3364674 RepID=UPI0036C456ED